MSKVACWPGSCGRRFARAPHRAMWRRCRNDTSEISADYACSKSRVNVSHSHHRPSRKCQRTARRAGAVKARHSTPNVIAVGADQRCLDGAEHRAILSDVMARTAHEIPAHRARFQPDSSTHSSPTRARRIEQQTPRRERPECGPQSEAGARSGVVHAVVSVCGGTTIALRGGRERRPFDASSAAAYICEPATRCLPSRRIS